MKKLIVVACLALGAGILVTVAQDAAAENGCSPIGTWATDPDVELDELNNEPPAWIGTITGPSSSSGTVVTDVPHWPNLTFIDPATGEPAFPSAVRISALRGVWERTGGNTFAFTQIGWAVDAEGDSVYVV